jgi:hypothetical protein
MDRDPTGGQAQRRDQEFRAYVQSWCSRIRLSRRISAAIAQITQRLWGDLPAEDLATAGRVLAIITERANAKLAH